MTSGSKSRAARKDEKAELRADLEKQQEAGRKAQAEKLQQSKDHLGVQLNMAAEKYLTVNGFMQARSTFEQVLFGSDVDEDDANDLARQLAETISLQAKRLAVLLDETDVFELDDTFLDGMLDPDFIHKRASNYDVAEQLLIVNLLQNIGPSIDEIVSFREGTAAQLAILDEELAKLDEKPPLKVV